MKEYFSFFLNPGPSILLTIVIFIAKVSGFDIPWVVVFVPMMIWAVALFIFAIIILWGIRKVWRKLKDFINTNKKVG